MSDWGGERLRDDVRWKYGAPPVGNANFAWVQHMIHHLAPQGVAGFVLANGSMSSQQIRRRRDPQGDRRGRPGRLHDRPAGPAVLRDADPGLPVVPGARQERRTDGALPRPPRGRRCSSTPARWARCVDRTHRELTDEEIDRIAGTYHAWRGEKGAAVRRRARLLQGATTEKIAEHGYVLTPGRYVGAEDAEDDGEPFDEKMSG